MSQTSYRDEPSTSVSMLDRASAGDPESWQQLARVYGPIIYGWVRRRGLQSADAADVMQDALISVAAALKGFDAERSGATFRGWLWTITRNKLRDRQRRATGDSPVGGSVAHLAMQRLPAPEMDDHDPPTDARSDSLSARRRMVDLLRPDFDPRSWRMFWETTVLGRQVAEVATEMGVSKWAVYKARARVLQRLQQEFRGLE